MSMFALMTAIVDRLKLATASGGLAYTVKTCGIAPPNGQPPPSCGPYYVAVHEAMLSDGDSYSTLEEIYNVNVTVTIRLRGTPYDRIIQEELYNGPKSLDTRCRQIAALIHQDTHDHRIINAANAIIDPPGPGHAVQGFVEPLKFAGMDTAREVNPSWFWADQAIDANTQIMSVGWAKTIRFTGARRVQETLFAEGIGVIS